MAERLKLSVEQLAMSLMSWTPEERFAGMKRFYLAAYPRSAEFYESFSKLKACKTDSSSQIDRQVRKNESKSNKIEIEAEPVDYYDQLNTFENVLDLIDDNEEEIKTNLNVEIESRGQHDEIDSLYEKFMNKTSDIDMSIVTKNTYDNSHDSRKNDDLSASEREKETFKQKLIKPDLVNNSNSGELTGEDKYDRLLNEIFE